MEISKMSLRTSKFEVGHDKSVVDIHILNGRVSPTLNQFDSFKEGHC